MKCEHRFNLLIGKDENVMGSNGMNRRNKNSQTAIRHKDMIWRVTSLLLSTAITESKAGNFKNINICVFFIVKEG